MTQIARASWYSDHQIPAGEPGSGRSVLEDTFQFGVAGFEAGVGARQIQTARAFNEENARLSILDRLSPELKALREKADNASREFVQLQKESEYLWSTRMRPSFYIMENGPRNAEERVYFDAMKKVRAADVVARQSQVDYSRLLSDSLHELSLPKNKSFLEELSRMKMLKVVGGVGGAALVLDAGIRAILVCNGQDPGVMPLVQVPAGAAERAMDALTGDNSAD